MSVKFEIPVYGLTGSGKKMKICSAYDIKANAKRVGGKIYYIDQTASGATYTFYDSEGNSISESSIHVGDTPYAYEVSGTPSKDKFYVFYNDLKSYKSWTYQEDGVYVYNLLNTSVEIGSGKTNTQIVLTADEGKYVSGDTLWKSLSDFNTEETSGCNDWYIPSKNEIEALRTAVDSEGNKFVNWFDSNRNFIYSSSEYNNSNAWCWCHVYMQWGSGWVNESKNNLDYFFFDRSF